MYDKLQEVREQTGTVDFHQSVEALAARIWPTEQLKMVEADIRRLHQQVAATIDDDEEWGPSNRKAARALIILGPNGSSKSFSVDYALRRLPPITIKSGLQVPANILYREVPQGDAKSWLHDTLSVLGYEMTRTPSPEFARGNVENRLRRNKFTMVAFDELSRVLSPRGYTTKRKLAEQAEIVWSQIIQIMSDPVWPTPVIASGTLDLIDTLELLNPRTREIVARGDMNRRADVTTLPRLDMGDAAALEAYLHQYCKDAGVAYRLRSTDEVGNRLVNASRRAIGTALSMCQWAVALASLRRRGALHMEDLAHVLAIRAGIPADSNLFLLDNWEDINFEKVAPLDFEQARYRDDDEEESI